MNRHAKAVWVYAIHHALEREGFSSETIFSANNFDFSAINSVNDNVSRATINNLWLDAVKLSQNDAFCLTTLDFINEPFINALVSVTRASPNIHSALNLLSKFYTLISPELEVSVSTQSDIEIRIWNVEGLGEWLPEDCDIALAIIAKHAFAIATSEIKPKSLKLTRPKPHNLSAYQTLFNCEIEFSADKNIITYPQSALGMSIPSANTHMHGHFEDYLEKSLKQQKYRGQSEPLVDKVEAFLSSKLGLTFPSLTETADHFHISPSAFKKHLHAEHASYQQIADKVREHHACKLIKKGQLSFKEIAFQLGFANSSAFNKAFKRWKGISPGSYAKQTQAALSEQKTSKSIAQRKHLPETSQAD